MNWTRFRNIMKPKSEGNEITDDLRGTVDPQHRADEVIPEHAKYHSVPNNTQNRESPPPSPLGLSNYDALDNEGDPYDEDWCDVDDECVNSDFNNRDINNILSDDSGSYFSSRDVDMNQPVPLTTSLGDSNMLLAQEDLQSEMSFAQFGPSLMA